MRVFNKIFLGVFLVGLLSLIACEDDPEKETNNNTLQLVSVKLASSTLMPNDTVRDLAVDQSILIEFGSAIDSSTVRTAIRIRDESGSLFPFVYHMADDEKDIIIDPVDNLLYETKYTLEINNELKGRLKEQFAGVEYHFRTKTGVLSLVSLTLNGEDFTSGSGWQNVDMDVQFVLEFDFPVDINNVEGKIRLFANRVIPLNIQFSEDQQSITVTNKEKLDYYRQYSLFVSSDLKAQNGYPYEGLVKGFFTTLDSSYKFPELSDDALLELIQQQTFKYFYDFAHPVSGLTRERNTSGDLVTSGGSGFGLMAIPVGIERGFITRTEGIARLKKMIEFLSVADRFHGVWSHWLNGISGNVIPFGADDDGGDLVETSYVAMGLMTVRQYLDPLSSEENELIQLINTLLESIEWDFYTQGEYSLTWHWSPNIGFQKNMKIRGWNEALITYVMAASSSNHSINRAVYDEGWALNGNMQNGKLFYEIRLPLGPDYGGPLFFEQYTFTGLNPENLEDKYGNYWDQAKNHTLINQAYCINNPRNYIGYSEDCWGLTASDGNESYSAHSPTNDRGVITPTAAISSIAYTPVESMKAIRHFYYLLGDRLWGPYGFYDAFNVTEEWYANSYLAIDQGPIILMIENYRTGLLWDLFMSSPEVQSGLAKLGFTY